MKTTMPMFRILNDLLNLFFPPTCHCCHSELQAGEHALCLSCQMELPRVHAYRTGNVVEERLFGHFPFERGTSFCFYKKTERFARMLQAAKYDGKPWINYDLAALFATELQHQAAWPGSIDLIIPVPVHRRRRLARGYNQSEQIARALSDCWHIECETHCLYKRRHTASQVHRDYAARYNNLTDSFAIKHPERLVGKHILLVDDVLTSGATLDVCANALLQVQSVTISFLTLGLSI